MKWLSLGVVSVGMGLYGKDAVIFVFLIPIAFFMFLADIWKE